MFTQLKHARKWVDKERQIVEVTITPVGDDDFFMVTHVNLMTKNRDTSSPFVDNP